MGYATADNVDHHRCSAPASKAMDFHSPLFPEVAQALYAHPGDFEENDAVERAICDLVSGGLLQCHGAFVLPTRAALYFSRLEME